MGRYTVRKHLVRRLYTMRKQSKLWLIAFIMVFMLAFVSTANCADPGLVYTVDVGTDCAGWGVSVNNGGNPWPNLLNPAADCRSTYRHYMNAAGKERQLVGVTKIPPSVLLMPVLLNNYRQIMSKE
jgi:hypothetical protein